MIRFRHSDSGSVKRTLRNNTRQVLAGPQEKKLPQSTALWANRQIPSTTGMCFSGQPPQQSGHLHCSISDAQL